MESMRKMRKFLSIGMLAVSIGACAAALPFALSVDAEGKAGDTTFTTAADAFFTKEYDVGDVVTIPEGTFSDGTDSVKADHVLITPDGQGKVAEEIALTQRGEYAVRYSATVGGENVEEVRTFLARTPLFTATGEQSTIEIGAASDYSAYEAGGKRGAIVSIAMNESVSYNRALDFSESTASDSFINISVLPSTVNVADAYKIVLKLTDAYDPANFITIELKKVRDGNAGVEEWSYVTAYGVGQYPQGLESSSTGSLEYDGQRYNLNFNNAYGCGVWFSLSGMATYNDGAGVPDEIGEQELSFSYDSARKRIYAGDAKNSSRLVIDLDDPIFNSTLFDGFTNDMAFLSISADSYNGTSCNLLINSVAGEAIDEDDLYLTDGGAPAIAVDDADLTSLDRLVVGVPVRIPSASAVDLYDGERDVAVNVYAAYGSSSQTDVEVKDGYFTPDKQTSYTIVYTASDASGNVAKEEYTFFAVRTDVRPQLDLSGNPSRGTVGQEVTIRVPSVSNASGNWTMHIVVERLGGDREEIASLTSADELQVISYRPMNAGTYEIGFEYSDYLYEMTGAIQIAVGAEDAVPVFLNDAPLPDFVIAGAEYDHPALSGWVFTDGVAVEKEATLYITQDGDIEGEQPVTGPFTIGSEQSECWFTYVLEDGTNTQQATYVRKVVDVGFGTDSLSLEKYFYGHSGAVRESGGIAYTLDSGATLEFVNFVQTIGFKVGFTIPAEGTDGVIVVLNDPEGGKAEFRYQRAADGTIAFSYGNGQTYSIADDFAGAAVTLTYDAQTKVLSPYSETELAADLSDVLISGKASLSFRVEGASPSIVISTVNNQNFLSSAVSDRIRPEIFREELLGSFSLGSKVALAPAYAADVLSPTLTVSLKVTAPDGTAVVTTDGIRLDGVSDIGRAYEIVLGQYGFYRVTYTATDAAGLTTTSYYNISVVDDKAPAAQIGSHSDTASVGDSIAVAAVTVTDDVSEADDCDVYIYVKPPQSPFFGVEAGGSFTADRAGVWQVYYYVSDAAGNMTVVSYTIAVS